MIQRKQSIYLLLITVLMSFMLVRPYAELSLKDGKTLMFHSLTIKMYSSPENYVNYKHTLSLFLVIVITGALSFINIFFYNRRILQMRLCIISYLLLMCILIIMFIYYSSERASLENIRHNFLMAGVFPILGIVMNFLAVRGIHQDEMLVKSYDRIR
jgi:hypothetical protein